MLGGLDPPLPPCHPRALASMDRGEVIAVVAATASAIAIRPIVPRTDALGAVGATRSTLPFGHCGNDSIIEVHVPDEGNAAPARVSVSTSLRQSVPLDVKIKHRRPAAGSCAGPQRMQLSGDAYMLPCKGTIAPT